MTTTAIAAPTVLRELVAANRILAREGVLDAFGHVSIRHPEQPDRYCIARSLGPALVTEDDLQLFTLVGEQIGGSPLPPYTERAIHGAIYEARPDVQAICHNHSPSVIPFSVTATPLQPIFHMAALLGGAVPRWDIADEFGDTDMLVRTVAQGRSLARALGARRVVLMRGHGSAVAGATLREVVMACVYLEQNARLQAQALAFGDVRYLSAGETDRMGAMLADPLGSERAWHVWRERAGIGD